MSESQFYLDLNELKGDKIIDFLPGIFYIYELVEEDFELIHWNTNHEKVTGYASSELRGKRVYDFFYPTDFEVISHGIAEILEKGIVKQVYANLRLKNGKTLPYLFEGYKFESNGSTCFLGVGLDVSTYVSAREELNRAKFDLHKRNKELFGFNLQVDQFLKFKEQLHEAVTELKKMESIDEVREGLSRFEKKMNAESKKQGMLEIFQQRFSEIHDQFFANLKLKHPSLTQSEIKYLAYLKIKLSNFQISALLNVGKEAIKKKKYRIRKKMGLDASLPLEVYIDQF